MAKWVKDLISGLLQGIAASWIISSASGKAVVSGLGALLLAFWTRAYAYPTPILVTLGLFVFVVILHGLTLLTRRQVSSVQEPPPPTHLSLQFNVGNALPVAIAGSNIWRWFALRVDGVWILFLLFDKPIAVKQFRFDGGGAALPLHEVKDSGPRHAIIVFNGGLSGLVLQINAVL